jgi:hypothetical protein
MTAQKRAGVRVLRSFLASILRAITRAVIARWKGGCAAAVEEYRTRGDTGGRSGAGDDRGSDYADRRPDGAGGASIGGASRCGPPAVLQLGIRAAVVAIRKRLKRPLQLDDAEFGAFLKGLRRTKGARPVRKAALLEPNLRSASLVTGA